MLLRFCSLLLLLPAVVFAQQASTSNMQSMLGMNHSGFKMVSGKDHPELISDSTAYRLWFIMAGEMPNPTPTNKARQMAHLKAITAIQQSDSDAMIPVLEGFKVRYQAMIDDYNARVEKAVQSNSPLPDQALFMAQRDQLVTDTRTRLKLALTPDGLGKLDAHIQKQKAFMKIAIPVTGGGL